MNTYPLITTADPEAVLYPYRQDCHHEVSRLKAGFCQWLIQQLPADLTVRNDIGICVSEQLPLICPDLVIMAKAYPDVRLAVEIDEPFEAATRKPQHYLTGGDNYRDNLLSRLGWTVIRFAEDQLWHHHKACADYLADILAKRIPHLEWTPLADEALPPARRWTRTEVLKMAARSRASQIPQPVVRMDPGLCRLTSEERLCLLMVKPMARTAEMTEKMATFTDAGCYEQDNHIDFEPEEHIYTLDGRERLLPVSSLIAFFFEPFDALTAAERQQDRYHDPVEQTLDKWARGGRIASEVGTFVHAQTENYFRDGTFETMCTLDFDGQEEVISVERERQHFLHFVDDYQIRPYRQEWPVYDRELNIAGTIDLICKEDDGTFTIYDWKRSGKVVNAQGQPFTEGFNGKMSLNGILLPDTAFYHYCIQQNLYRYMLETHYGLKVRAMNLVVLCPEFPTYFVAQVPQMDKVIEQIVGICHQRDLGHRLLF